VSGLEVLAVIGVIGFVIYQQLAGQPLLFTLGLNRVGQAAVIASRAMRAGVPFAPEKDGSTFLAGAFRGHDRDASGRY
jgi:hypothetical protein